MPRPYVAIVGRTNVGKSALFNRLAGDRLAVVEDQPGITRDRLYATVDIEGRRAMLVDTGGIVGGGEDELIRMVAEQAAVALQQADVLIIMVDGREGLTTGDHAAAEVVRKTGKPYVLVANKMEKPGLDAHEFAALRLGVPLEISAIHNQGVTELCQVLAPLLPPEGPEEGDGEPDVIRVAVVGRPNVGKSALVNALLGEPRVIVSDIPGTTREAIDIPVTVEGQEFLLVDTAGLRSPGRRKQAVEFYSGLRTQRAVERAHIAVVVLDAAEGPAAQDAHIAGQADEAGRAVLLVVNKWDLVRRHAFPDDEAPTAGEQRRRDRTLQRDFEQQVRQRMTFLDHAPLLFTVATEGEGVGQLLPLAAQIAEEYHRRVPTAEVNRALLEAVERHNPPAHRGQRLKVYYATQAQVAPPTFVCFVNDKRRMHWSYERYLLNHFRRAFGFQRTPLRLMVRTSAEGPFRRGGRPGTARRRRSGGERA